MRTEIEIRFIFSFHGNLVYVVQQDYLGNRVKQTTTSTSLQQLHNIELVSEKNHTQIMSFFCTHLFDSLVYILICQVTEAK